MRFRKRPVVIEAEQFAYDKEWPRGVCACNCTSLHQGRPHIHTLEGLLFVTGGDWIVTGVKGEHYPVKPDIFEMTYEPVDETENGI